jgi:choline kinase
VKVIISMSGLSSRFAAAGYTIPKFMIEVDGKTVIEHIVELYHKLGNGISCRSKSTTQPRH